MSAEQLPAAIVDRPTFTNPHIRMCALITAVINAWGEDGERTLRAAYRALGHVTGEYMIDTGVVTRHADLETYGRVSEQIMDLCGLHDWTRLETGPEEHATDVPRCAAYRTAYEAIGAPKDLCAIPFEWDNGCLDRINPALEIWPGPCAYREGEQCVYKISSRVTAGPTVDAGEAPALEQAPRDVVDAPTWTNPQAGLYTIVSCSVSAFGEEGHAAAERALWELGEHSGRFMLDEEVVAPGCGPLAAAELMGMLGSVAGFTRWTASPLPDGSAALDRSENPYLPVFQHFDAPSDIQWLVAAWDRGWLSVVDPALELRRDADRFAGGASDRFVFAPVVS